MKMKKLMIVAFLAISNVVCVAQESVLLRWNNKVGDKFDVKATIKQDMGAEGVGDMNMRMNMTMNIVDKKEGDYICEMKYNRFLIDMTQGGIDFSFDTDKKEGLSEAEERFKEEIKPMLEASVVVKYDERGKTKQVKIEPDVPTLREFANQYESIEYPEKAVKVGSSWETEKENNGMKIKMTQTVKKITKEKVIIDVTGKVPGMDNVNLSGVLEVHKKTGIPLKMYMIVKIDAMGKTMSTTVTMETKKRIL